MINNNLKSVVHDFLTNSFEVDADIADFYVKSNNLFNIKSNELMKDNYYFFLYIDGTLISFTNKFEFDDNLGLWRINFFANDYTIVLPISKISKEHRKINILATDYYYNNKNYSDKFDLYPDIFYKIGFEYSNWRSTNLAVNYHDSQLKQDCKITCDELYVICDMSFEMKNIGFNSGTKLVARGTITFPWQMHQRPIQPIKPIQPKNDLIIRPVKSIQPKNDLIIRPPIIDKYQKLIPNLIEFIRIIKDTPIESESITINGIYFLGIVSKMIDNEYINVDVEQAGLCFDECDDGKVLHLSDSIKTLVVIKRRYTLFPKLVASNLESVHFFDDRSYISDFSDLAKRLPKTVTNLTLIDSCSSKISINELPSNIKTLTIVQQDNFEIKKIPVTVDFIIYNPSTTRAGGKKTVYTIKIARHLVNKLVVVDNVNVEMLD